MTFRYRLMLAAFLFAVAPSGTAVEPPSTLVEFDARNSITHHLRRGSLVVVADDVVSTITIEQRFEYLRDPITRDVRRMRYLNVQSVWIISRLGRRLNGAILYDLKHDRILRRYWGQVFGISPDGEHLAFAYPGGMEPSYIFIDSSMVYPAVEHGFTVQNSDGPQKPDGKAFHEFRPSDDSLRSVLISPLHWKNDHSIEAVIRRVPENRSGSFTQDAPTWSHLLFEASIEFGGERRLPRIEVSRTPLERYAVRTEMNRIREAEGLPPQRPPRLRLR